MGKLNTLGTVAKQAITGDFGKAFGKTIASHLEDPKIGKAFGIAAEGLFNAGIGAAGGAAGGAVIGGIAGAIDEKSSVGEGMSRGALTGAGLGMLAGGVGITGYGNRDKIMDISGAIAKRTASEQGGIAKEIYNQHQERTATKNNEKFYYDADGQITMNKMLDSWYQK
jgi:hypothetical protein